MPPAKQTKLPEGVTEPHLEGMRCEFCPHDAKRAIELKTTTGVRSGRFIYTCHDDACLVRADRLAAMGVKLS